MPFELVFVIETFALLFASHRRTHSYRLRKRSSLLKLRLLSDSQHKMHNVLSKGQRSSLDGASAVLVYNSIPSLELAAYVHGSSYRNAARKLQRVKSTGKSSLTTRCHETAELSVPPLATSTYLSDCL